MKKIPCLLFAISCTMTSIGQQRDETLTKLYKKFLPSKYVVIDTAVSDFNNDKINDIVLVAEDTADLSKNRAIIILNNIKHPTFSDRSYNAVLCKECGGTFGDPYEEVQLKKNILKINDYGGSAWRWGNQYTFRFQNERWELIGVQSLSYWTMADCDEVGSGAFNLTDVNFSTRTMHIVKTKDDECKPYLDKWVKLTSFKKVFLRNLNQDNDYLPDTN